MVADIRLCDYRNVAAERSVPALEQQDVFFRRQIHIGRRSTQSVSPRGFAQHGTSVWDPSIPSNALEQASPR
jgi:hypothetical protein